ncbi:MAG: proprotein convertase P-domain-containing protein, partial [Flavobacteriia bacterium]|nr:proprotein convertase P-domain-containing protein [Flavobacteriia bacterium]
MKNFILILSIIFPISYWAQNITLTTNGSSSQCSGNFYDSGGSSTTGPGKYGNNQDYTWTICPTGTSLVSLNFTTFDVDAGDILYVYDGNSTSATSLGGYNNNVPLVGTVQATTANPSGCLTFRFISNGATTAGGWVASISCITPCQLVQAVSTPSITPTSGIIKVCQGQAVTFNGTGSFPQNGTYYTQSSATSTYAWSVTNPSGTTTSPTTQNTTQTFSTQGAYHIDLVVTDNRGCVSTNTQEVVVEVSTTPHFTGTGATQASICLGQTNTINGVVTPVPYTEDCTPPVGGTVYLPDGTGTAYTTSTTISCYSSGQTITNANQIASICMNMEHSYLGDLDITITCPTGQTVTLLDYSSSDNTGCEYLGTPVDNDATPSIAGTGANYCFTSSASQTMNTAAASIGCSVMLPATNYLPIQSFSGLVGCQVNGDWTITILDNLGSDNGYIFGWSVDFSGLTPANQLTYTPAVSTQNWTANSTITSTSGNNITVLPTTTGSQCYTYRMTDSFGCTYDTTVCFMVTASPTPTFNPVAAVCQFATAPTLPTSSTNSPAITGTWSPSVSTATAGTQTYTFTPTPGQCATTTTLNITVNAAPTITINNATVCNGTSATLTATPSAAGGTYLWNTGATTAAITVTPSSTTTYSCVYTLAGCPSTSVSGTVTVNPVPTITINNAT